MSTEPRTSNRLKSAAILAVTLVIGMVLGGLITARIVQQRFDQIAALRSERGFHRFIERAIEYESPEQREQVREVIDRMSGRMFEHLRSSRSEATEILDSARAELSEILSAEQMEQLEKRLRRRRMGGPPMRGRRGPPVDGPPHDRPPPPPGN
jgi:vacuolar-type H+-ATPase subunit H